MTLGTILLIYEYVDSDTDTISTKLKSSTEGTVQCLIAKEGDIINPGSELLELQSCLHSVVMKDLCAECGADLRELGVDRLAQVVAQTTFSMIHSVPELRVSQEQARKLGEADEARLLKSRKLVLLVDLDQTLIHTTNENIPADLPGIFHFQLYGARSPWYHTRFRPGTHNFLQKISALFELHIFTFGARPYAHHIASLMDPKGCFFSHRILSRDECLSANSKSGNLKALFPCGDSMVCIIDDREDVWNFAPNVIQVKPYHFFSGTGDINAPSGLDPTDVPSSAFKNTVPQNTNKTEKYETKPPSFKEKNGKKDTESEIDSESKIESESNSLSKEDSTNNEAQKQDRTDQDKEPTNQNADNEGCNDEDKMNSEIITDPSQNSEEKKPTEDLKNKDVEGETEISCENNNKLAADNGSIESTEKSSETSKKENGFGNSNDKTETKKEDGKTDTKKEDDKTETKKEDDKTETKKEDENNGKPTDSTSEKQPDSPDHSEEDDYLMYLEDILSTIHQAFYDMYDQLQIQGSKIPDLKTVIPYVRRKVLKGVNIVFSGVIPTTCNPEKSKLWSLAKAFGANITIDLKGPDLPNATTHVIAARLGTAKVNKAKKMKGVHIVNPEWLSSCAERWERVEERLYPLTEESILRKPIRRPEHRDKTLMDFPPNVTYTGHAMKAVELPEEQCPVYDPVTGKRIRVTTSQKPVPFPVVHVKNIRRSKKLDGHQKIGPPDSFSNSLSPLLSFSSNEIEAMGREVDDACSEESGNEAESSSDSNAGIKGKKNEESTSEESLDAGDRPRGWKKRQRKLENDADGSDSDGDAKIKKEESSSDGSMQLGGGKLKGWKKRQKLEATLTEKDCAGVLDSEDETCTSKFPRHEIPVDSDRSEVSNSDDSNESIGSVDEEMAAAVEREFLGC